MVLCLRCKTKWKLKSFPDGGKIVFQTRFLGWYPQSLSQLLHRRSFFYVVMFMKRNYWQRLIERMGTSMITLFPQVILIVCRVKLKINTGLPLASDTCTSVLNVSLFHCAQQLSWFYGLITCCKLTKYLHGKLSFHTRR